MKRLLWCVLLVIVSLSSLLAVDFGISVGTFDSYGRHESFNDGTHVQIGSVIGMSSHLEWEAFLIAEATPVPFSELVVGTALSTALVGPVFVDPQVDEVPPYANIYASVGFLGGVGGNDSYGPFLRVTPISVGGPQFLLRERGASTGIFYDIPNSSLTIFWNIFLVDFFL